jgi:hypothetical protein
MVPPPLVFSLPVWVSVVESAQTFLLTKPACAVFVSSLWLSQVVAMLAHSFGVVIHVLLRAGGWSQVLWINACFVLAGVVQKARQRAVNHQPHKAMSWYRYSSITSSANPVAPNPTFGCAHIYPKNGNLTGGLNGVPE